MAKKNLITLIVLVIWLILGIIASFFFQKGEGKIIPSWRRPTNTQQAPAENSEPAPAE